MRRMTRLYPVLCLILAVGCASAGKNEIGGRPDGGHQGGGVDSDIVPIDSAPLPDAPPGKMTVTLGQTNDMTVAAGTSVACGDASSTSDNNWYRVFRLSDYNVTKPFSVQQVSFMIDLADSLAGQQPVQVKIGSYTGTVDAATLNKAQITPVAAMQVQVPNGDASSSVPPPVQVAIGGTFQPNQNIVVEVDVPDGSAALDYFYIGVSAGGDTHPSYISSVGCSLSTPTSFASQGFAANAVLLNVTGTY
jgi:hypothetical protein